MFEIGWSELLVIAVVAIIVVGPKDLPRMMRSFGAYAGKLRRMAADFQRQFDDAMREAEIEEVRKAMHSVRDDLNAPVVDKKLMLPNPSPAAPPPEVKPSTAASKKKPKKKPAKPSKSTPSKSKANKPSPAKKPKPKASRGKQP
jgi:sec-independent protein translocase protein TatB